MHKIRKSVIDKIIGNKCTGAEIRFLLHIMQFQSNNGVVRHVKCKDICFAISISKQSFYNILRSLVKKNIIVATKQSFGEYSIKIINNAFVEYKDFGKDKGYITTQYEFLNDSSFHNLKLNAKRLALKMMRVLYRLDTDKTFKVSYKVMLNWLSIKNKRILLGYLSVLEPYFVIYYNTDFCTFRLRKVNPIAHYRVKNTEMYKYLHYRFSHICRKHKIAYTSSDLTDFILLFRQYPSKHKRLFFAFISTTKKIRLIQPALIHSIILKAA